MCKSSAEWKYTKEINYINEFGKNQPMNQITDNDVFIFLV